MSNLEELIERLCPDGVEYKKIGEIGTLTRGKRFVHADAVEDNGIPCIHYGELYTYYGVTTYDIKSQVKKELANKLRYASKNDVVIVGAGENAEDIGIAVAYLGESEIAVHDACYIWKHHENPKYLSYCLRTRNYHEQLKKYVSSGKICSVSATGISKIQLPVPPLEVQREIVRILDNFTFLTTELAAELAARQKQYEYYKEYLFENHIFDVEWKRLDELFPFIRNGFVGTIKSFFTNETDGIRYLEGTNIHDGVISDNEVLYVTKEFHKKHIKNQLKADDILMVQSGHIGECAVVGKKYEGSNCHALIIMSNGGKCLSKYYVYYFHTIKGFKSLTPAITGGTIKHVLAGKVGKIKVPVPSLEQQQRIVDILDRFDALCNDISSGLPAEIEARQKQYEYYRDKLLTFKELKKEA